MENLAEIQAQIPEDGGGGLFFPNLMQFPSTLPSRKGQPSSVLPLVLLRHGHPPPASPLLPPTLLALLDVTTLMRNVSHLWCHYANDIRFSRY
jgi:hypothetical protein